MTSAADHAAAPSRAPRDEARRRPRWPYLAFFALAAAFGWQLLLQGRVLLPTNPATVPPWGGDTSAESAAVPSNGLMMDTLIFTLPARIYNAEMMRAGEIPFWNPHVFAGYPHFALIQNNVLYPPSTLFDLIEPVSGMGYSICLHLALAGCLMFAFLRARGLDDTSAFLGAAAFELNGMFLIRVSAPSYVFSGTWLPLMLLGALRIARGGGLRDGWPLLLATAASVLGGHPQITALCLTLAGTFLLVETIAADDDRAGLLATKLAGSVAALAVLVVLAVGLVAYQVVPFLELMANSARRPIPLEVYRHASTPFTGLLQALIPDVFGHPVELDYWFADRAQLVDGIAPGERAWALNFSGQNFYTGIVPLVLAVVAVARAPQRRDVLLFAAAALFSLGVVLGTPLLDVAYALIPGFRHSRPDRILFVYMTALSVLTAYGFASLTGDVGARDAHSSAAARAADARSRTRGALAVLAIAVVILLWPVVPRLADAAARADLAAWLGAARLQWTAHRAALLPQVAGTVLLLVASTLLALPALRARLPRAATLGVWTALLVVPSLLFGWRFNPMQYRPVFGQTALERALVERAGQRAARTARLARILPGLPQALPANVVQLLGVDDIHGASAAGVAGYLDLIDAAESGSVNAHKYFRAFRDPAITQGRLLDLLSAELVLANVELPAGYERLASEDGLTLYRNPRALPRFFVVADARPYDTPEEGRARLLAREFDPAARVLVDGNDVALPAIPTLFDSGSTAPPEASVTVTESAPHRIRLRVTTPQQGILVSSEVFYPGWRTWVDGQDVATLLVNTAFRGAIVPAGTHDVEMAFVPRSFQLGMLVSALTLVVIAFVWWPRRAATAADRG